LRNFRERGADQNNNPLFYTKEMESWTYDDPATGDWVPGEGAGYGGYSGTALRDINGTGKIQGLQASEGRVGSLVLDVRVDRQLKPLERSGAAVHDDPVEVRDVEVPVSRRNSPLTGNFSRPNRDHFGQNRE
jgi:hypothetical protein